MADIKSNLAAYTKMQDELEAKYMGKWVLFYDDKFISVFETFEDAAQDAVKQFGRGPYLITQVGAPPVTLPASLMFRPAYA